MNATPCHVLSTDRPVGGFGWGARALRLLMLLMSADLALLAQDSDRDGLADAWERGVGRYEIVSGSFTWHQARLDAQSRGGYLATVVNGVEWENLNWVLGASLHGRNLWLGGTDEGREGEWRWVTGEPWTFSHWRLNEPGNDSLGNGMGVAENHLMIWGRETAAVDNQQAYWNDVTADGGVLARDGYILERGHWTDMLDPDTDDDGLADGQEGLGLKRFEIVFGTRDWPSAQFAALQGGGHLAVITSSTEWQAVVSEVGSNLFSLPGPIWLGASDALQEGTWRWVTGDAFSFQRWAPGQPDNAAEQDHLALMPAGGLWMDVSSNLVASGYLLEREPGTSPQTNPTRPDTDGDGLLDGDEVRFYRTDPVRTDTDGDGLTDFDELRRWRSNPLSRDTDGEGLSDGEEIYAHGTDPTKSDTDGDGFSDSLELGFGSDPRVATSLPGPRARISKAVEVTFETRLGEKYQIQLQRADGRWVDHIPVSGNGLPASFLISPRQAGSGRFRVVMVP